MNRISAHLSFIIRVNCNLKCLSYLLLDLLSSGFGVLEVLHEGCVSQEVTGSRGQATQQVILKVLQLDLEVILLLC